MEKRKTNFDDIINSKNGQHISIYLKNDMELKEKTKYFVDQIQRILLKHHGVDDTIKLIKPIYSALRDKKTLSHFGENIGLFKKNGYMRMVNIPTKVEDLFVLSKTFHVKPLLSVQQEEAFGTLIYCEKEAVRLISVNSHSSHLVSEFHMNTIMSELEKYDGKRLSTSCFMLGKQLLLNWLEDTFHNKKSSLVKPIFVYGDTLMSNFVTACLKSVTKNEVIGHRIAPVPNKKEAIEWSRSKIKRFKKDETAKMVHSFSAIDEDEFVSYDFQEILHNLLSGRVRKIMVARDQTIFGKIEKKISKDYFYPLS